MGLSAEQPVLLVPEGKEVLFLSSSAPVAQLVEVSALRQSKADLERYEAQAADEWPVPGTFSGWPEPETAGDRPGLITDLPDIATAPGTEEGA
ncbi:hypothetical protein GCM10010191_45680 [Actinomadura vinacea]|uniref:Uncharacterized protein n=1 Tax=Actinomadura vinacea TaxID=115336 RepID=A0ABN3JG39_9ACTN